MEFLKDYDCTILYHLEKANMVADALSRKSMGSLTHITPMRRPLIVALHSLESSGVQLAMENTGRLLAQLHIGTSLTDRIKEEQDKDPKLQKLREEVLVGKSTIFRLDLEGVL